MPHAVYNPARPVDRSAVQNIRLAGDGLDDLRRDYAVVMAWLTYEVVAFYLNIISVVFFLIVASFKKFKTIRERLGFAGQERKSVDFLTYVKDDIHWWQLWFVQLTLYICGLAFRTTTSYAIGLSAS